MGSVRVCASASLLCLATAVWSQGDLANTSTASINEPRAWTIDFRGNFHRNAEDRTYASVGFRYGLQPGWELGARGSFAAVGNSNSPAVIRTGGRDLEFYARYAPTEINRLVLMGGVSFPNTPSQDQPFATFAATYGLPTQDGRFNVYVGGRGVLRSDSSLVGVSGGAEVTVADNFQVFGDITGIVHGNNTRDTVTGLEMRQAVWGLGVRYNFMSTSEDGLNGSIFALFGNGLGTTTGMSLSSALGNRPALTVGFSLRGRS